jgi:F-type H+-transporting ATPase subunit delta
MGASGNGRVDVSEPASISTGIAGRYAQAVFDLAREENLLPAVEADIRASKGRWRTAPDLRDLIASPIYSREEQAAGIAAIGQRMGLSPVMLTRWD